MNYFLWILFSHLALAQLFDTSLYYLGGNVLVNSNFSQPFIPAGTSYAIVTGSIQGWICNISCDVKNMVEQCADVGVTCNVNFTKGVDF